MDNFIVPYDNFVEATLCNDVVSEAQSFYACMVIRVLCRALYCWHSAPTTPGDQPSLMRHDSQWDLLNTGTYLVTLHRITQCSHRDRSVCSLLAFWEVPNPN